MSKFIILGQGGLIRVISHRREISPSLLPQTTGCGIPRGAPAPLTMALWSIIVRSYNCHPSIRPENKWNVERNPEYGLQEAYVLRTLPSEP